MLTLKKKRRDQNVDLVLKEKKPLLTKTLLEAFVIAAIFHAGLLFLFRIAPLSPFFVETIFPPVNVQTDLNSFSNQKEDVLAMTDLEVKNHTFFYPPPLSKPMLTASMETFTLQPSLLPQTMGAHSLNQLTKAFEEDLLFNFSSTTQETFLSIYGELAGRPYELKFDLKTLMPTEALYYVTVDNRTGKIFMSKALYQNGTKQIKKQTEKLLKAIQFSPEKGNWISEGYVEIKKT